MKKVILISFLTSLFLFSISTVQSPFVELRQKSTLQEIAPSEIEASSIQATCITPAWTECPDGYECVNYNFAWLYGRGKKFGWTCDGGLITDPGPHNYIIRIVMDISLLYWDTVTSKTLFSGNNLVNVTPSSNIITMSSSIDFNYTHPGVAYVFEPSYVYGENALYYDCAIMWVNFSQSDEVNIGIPIEYRTYINDLNRDNYIDIYDGIIVSNEFGQSWGSPGTPVDTNDYTWRADINSDGTINILDYSILKSQFGMNYTKPMHEGTLLNIWEPMWTNTLDCDM